MHTVLEKARSRIAVPGVVITFVVLAVLAIATRSFIHERTYADLDDELVTLSTAVASELELQGLEGFEHEKLSAGVEANVFAFRLEHHNAILLVHGEIVGYTGDIAHRATVATVTPLIRLSEEPFTAREPFTGQRRLCRFRIAHLGGAARGAVLIVFRPIDRFVKSLARIDVALAILVFIGSLVSAIVLVVAVRRALVPVERITAVAETLQATDLESRVPVSGASEFRHLATVINSLFDRIDHAFKSQQRLVADAAHELKTPVAVIVAEAQQALRDDQDGISPRESLESIVTTSRGIAREVDDLLELAQGEATLGEEHDEIDVALVARQVVDTFSPVASLRGIDLVFDGPESIPLVANESAIQRMLANLVSNAIHYSRDGGDVRVVERDEQDWVRIDVEDRGPGVPPEDRGRIFDRFVRLPGTRGFHREGSGLGLAIVDQIVRRHSGSVIVLDRDDGGSVFRVLLPRT